jgi:Helix-turn-helix domain
MTDIIDSPAPGNGANDTSRKKFQLRDRLMGDRQLTEADLRVAYFLVSWFNPAKGCAWPSQATLAEWTGLGLRAVKYATARLVALGLFTVRTRGRRGHATEYVPNWDYYGARRCTPYTTTPE